MIPDKDSIIFSSRDEIRAILTALESYQKDHPDTDTDTIDQMIGCLDVIDMSW